VTVEHAGAELDRRVAGAAGGTLPIGVEDDARRDPSLSLDWVRCEAFGGFWRWEAGYLARRVDGPLKNPAPISTRRGSLRPPLPHCPRED
jgi:hypothetical protein